MTETELRERFNLHYNNILSNTAPGLNDYEISLYLTQAHREVVNSYYEGTYKGRSYDKDEIAKANLNRYIRSEILVDYVTSEPEFGLYHSIFTLPPNVWYRLAEGAIFSTTSTPVLIKPITHDDYYMLVDNPLKRPNESRAWSLEYNDGNEDRKIKLITYNPNPFYKLDYLMVPEPIIIGDFSTIMPDINIEGLTTTSIPVTISTYFWESIISRAVELATRDYKENNLNTQIQTNLRQE